MIALYQIIISEAAEQDIREAFEWYELQKDDLGNAFKEQVEKALVSLKTNPLKHQIRYKSIRIYFLKKFPYGIHFNVKENQVLILAIFHTALNPKKWNG